MTILRVLVQHLLQINTTGYIVYFTDTKPTSKDLRHGKLVLTSGRPELNEPIAVTRLQFKALISLIIP